VPDVVETEDIEQLSGHEESVGYVSSGANAGHRRPMKTPSPAAAAAAAAVVLLARNVDRATC
jgi:hypothetical protein